MAPREDAYGEKRYARTTRARRVSRWSSATTGLSAHLVIRNSTSLGLMNGTHASAQGWIELRAAFSTWVVARVDTRSISANRATRSSGSIPHQERLAVSRDRGVDACECDVADVCELETVTFDTVVVVGNNFGLVGTRATAPRILGELAAVTSNEACLLVESRDVYASKDPDHLAYHELNRLRGRLPGALRIRVRFKRHMSPWFDYLMVSLEEMRDVVDPTP